MESLLRQDHYKATLMTDIWIRRRLCLVALLTVLCGGASTAESKADYKDASLPVDRRVEDLLARMSLEEKVAQMRIFHATKGVRLNSGDKMVLSEDVKQRLKLGIAGIKNPGEHLTPYRAAVLNNQLQKYVIQTSRLGIPAMFVTEAYNGVDADGCTRFGRPINMAATWNVELTRRIWGVIGREARLRGLHMCHSPEADIVRDPRFGRMSEAFGEDTHLTTEMTVAAVQGVQGGYAGTGLNTTHIGAVTKHFAGYGQVLGGTNFAAIEISPRTLADEIMPPFQAAVQRAHTLGVMASHGDINGVASHANPWLLTDVLRDQWGFRGYVVSDSNDIARLHSFMKVAETPEAAVLMALRAGIDVDLYSDVAYAMLPGLARRDPGLVALIDRAASRVLRTKFILGLFDQPYVELDQVRDEVRAAASLDLARQMDEESIVLLKNDKNLLPLSKHEASKVVLLGPLLGEGTLEAFESVVGDSVAFEAERGFKLTDEKGGNPNLSSDNGQAIEKMVAMAGGADVVLLFLGGDEFTAKEAYFAGTVGDRDSIDPVGQQDELVRRVAALGKPVVVVLKHRRTLSVNVIAERAGAVLDCWDLSEFGDEVLARVVFGEISPSGKLPVTTPRSIGRIPFHYSQKEINYKKGYLFATNGPLYPFGHGLSYTTFEYANLRLSDNQMARDGRLLVRVDVSNTGDYAAKEVVQLYLKDVIGSVTRPDKELKAFQKIELGPGESRTVEFAITPSMLAFTGLDMEPVLEAGDYEVMVGGSSNQGIKATFQLAP